MRINSQSAGFSLIEVNVAILMIAVGLLALFSLFPLGLKESERGLADTQEAMFADTVLSGLEGNAIGMTNWLDWTDMARFRTEVKKGVQNTIEGSETPVGFPSGTRYKLRYRLAINTVAGDDARKQAKLEVMHGTYGNFKLASVYYTEFVYTGM